MSDPARGCSGCVLDCRCNESHDRVGIHRIIEREGNLYVALCPDLDVASQGTSIENALENLKEAVALFIETADPGEMKERRREHVFVTQFQAADG
jgi:predicted RNase H-like HicB family nuclease